MHKPSIDVLPPGLPSTRPSLDLHHDAVAQSAWRQWGSPNA